MTITDIMGAYVGGPVPGAAGEAARHHDGADGAPERARRDSCWRLQEELEAYDLHQKCAPHACAHPCSCPLRAPHAGKQPSLPGVLGMLTTLVLAGHTRTCFNAVMEILA